MLDDLLVAEDGAAGSLPLVGPDYLAVVDELRCADINVAPETLAAQYREAGDDLAAEFAALLEQARLALAQERPDEREAPPPPIDPQSIAAELGLDRPGIDLRQARRAFAFANHPDRVAPHLRQRAMIRMQVANMLIDEAKRKALATRKS